MVISAKTNTGKLNHFRKVDFLRRRFPGAMENVTFPFVERKHSGNTQTYLILNHIILFLDYMQNNNFSKTISIKRFSGNTQKHLLNHIILCPDYMQNV